MREPSLAQLKIDEAATERMRKAIAASKAVKITITLDRSSLKTLQELSRKTGVPYQDLIGKTVKDAMRRRITTDSRIDRLERELKKMKRMLVA